MTEAEFAAIKERWGSNCHPADSSPVVTSPVLLSPLKVAMPSSTI